MNKSMANFLITVKNSLPSTHWKYFSKSNEVTILKKEIIDVQKGINKGNASTHAKAFCARMAKRQHLYGMSHLI